MDLQVAAFDITIHRIIVAVRVEDRDPIEIGAGAISQPARRTCRGTVISRWIHLAALTGLAEILDMNVKIEEGRLPCYFIHLFNPA